MYTRQVKAEQYYQFKSNLDKIIEGDPIQTYYQCDITINSSLYRLQLKFLKRCRIVPLKVIRLNIGTDKHELINQPMLLGALIEIALAQYGVVK